MNICYNSFDLCLYCLSAETWHNSLNRVEINVFRDSKFWRFDMWYEIQCIALHVFFLVFHHIIFTRFYTAVQYINNNCALLKTYSTRTYHIQKLLSRCTRYILLKIFHEILYITMLFEKFSILKLIFNYFISHSTFHCQAKTVRRKVFTVKLLKMYNWLQLKS